MGLTAKEDANGTILWVDAVIAFYTARGQAQFAKFKKVKITDQWCF
jgi:hypothetical protein